MAWIEPVTNRDSIYTRTTVADMNRIVGNIIELGGNPIKRSYSRQDIPTESEWTYITNFCKVLDPLVTSSSHYENLNRMEQAIKDAHDT